MAATKELVRAVVMDLVKQQVRDDESLVISGLIDSLRVLTLITALEQKLATRIPTEQLQPEDFDSINSTMETLARVGVGTT